jgi:hypothetical protein
VPVSILFTPGQLMAALSLSKQQWRTYRRALSPLDREPGRSACFTAGDLLAAAVAQHTATSLQMPISTLTVVADELFGVCGAHPWIRLERASLVIILDEGRVVLLEPEYRLPVCALALLIELRPLAAELRERLLAAGSDPQRDLAFPPMIAGRRS